MCKTNDQATKFVNVCPAIMNARGDVDEAAFEAAQNLIAAFESVAYGPDAEGMDDLCDELERAMSDRLVYLVDEAWETADDDNELSPRGQRLMAQAQRVYSLMDRAGMTIGEVEARLID